MIPIKMPSDIVEGTECLDCEVPWQVEESIYKEDEILNENDVVLEVGTGGSTLFYARRCKHVTAIETNPDWMKQVSDKLFNSKILNVSYQCIADETEICRFIEKLDTNDATVFSVDTQGGYNRSRILNSFFDKGVSPKLRIVILDNYAHEGLFPVHFDIENIMGDGWDVFTYNHDRWAGSGTKILIKK